MASDNSNLYDDGPAQSPAPAPDTEAEPTGEEGQTTLLPKSVVGGKQLKPGDVCELEVVADHGDEYEVKYAGEAGGEPAGKPEKPEAGGGEMASMLED